MTTQNKITKTITDNDSHLVKVVHSVESGRIVICSKHKNEEKKQFLFSFTAAQVCDIRLLNSDVQLAIKLSEEKPYFSFYTHTKSQDTAQQLIDYLEEIILDCLF